MKYFWKLKNNRRNNIYLDVTLPEYASFELCLGVGINPDQWDQKRANIKSIVTPELMFIHERMQDMLNSVCRIYMLAVLNNEIINPDRIKNLIKGNTPILKPKPYLPMILERYLSNKSLSDSRCRSLKWAVDLFEETNLLSCEDISISDVENFASEAGNKLEPVSVNSLLNSLKMLFAYGQKFGIITRSDNPFVDFGKVRVDHVEPTPRIEVLEYNQILNYLRHTFDTSEGNVKVAKFMMIQQLCCGMAYVDIDMNPIKKITLKGDIFYYEYIRRKTNKKAAIPMINKYYELVLCASYPSNMKLNLNQYNELIQVIVDECFDAHGYDKKKVRSHGLRKSFGDFMLHEGYSMESVSKMLGHSSIVETEKVYALVGFEKLSSETRNQMS